MSANVAEQTVPDTKTKSKPKSKSNSNTNNVVGRILTMAQANIAAMKTGDAQVVGTVFVLPLLAVKEYDNPRVEPATLHEQGFILFGDPTVLEATDDQFVSLVHLALDEDIQNVSQFVELIEQYEGPICKVVYTDPETGKSSVVFTGTEYFCKEKKSSHSDSKNCKVEKHLSAPQSIVELAKDIEQMEQLEPIHVQKRGNKYVMAEGGRRAAAIMYLHAKSRIAHDKDSTLKIFPPTIKAVELKCKADDLYMLSGMINISSKAFTPLQEGRFYFEFCKRVNPDTGKEFTMKEAATKLGVEYGTFRNRKALWEPRVDAVVDDEGNIVTPAKGLTDVDRTKISMNELTVTAATRKALGERHFSDTGKPSSNRNRGLPLSEMQKLFDETAESNKERRQAICECMGIELPQAIEESEKRINDLDRVDLSKKSKKDKAA